MKLLSLYNYCRNSALKNPIYILGFMLMFISFQGKSQLVTVSPNFPKDDASISIIMDCTRGNKGLMNYANTGDVYVHIGLITSASTGNSDWKYVKYTWGTTDAGAKAFNIGPNKYQYTVNNIRSFFAVPAGETIKKIAILFRSGNGNQVQRNADGSDMYISIYGSTLAGRFIDPPLEPKYFPTYEPITKNIGDTIRFNWQCNNTSSLQYYFNGSLISTPSGTSIIDSQLISKNGTNTLIVKAVDAATTFYDTLNFFVSPSTAILPLPSGVRDGLNYESGDTSVILVLMAPNKTRVTVIGDFNNWTEQPEYLMNRTPDGKRYWLRIKGLTPGIEYAYQYFVDGMLRIADPYTQKVLDPSNDTYISSTTYPSLKSYPTGKTTGNTSVLQTAKPAYNWQVTNFSRPDKRSMVVYEMLVRDFIANHDWKTLKDSLGYFKRMGINALEIMPFNEFEGNNSWGYNTSFYFAPDKYYGNDQSLKNFVDECHKAGIAVIMDIALNHAFGQSPMVQLYFDAALGRPTTDNPWYNPVAKHAFNVGYDMNHESLDTRYFVSRVVEHWLKEYKIDGFRFDLSKGFTQNATCDANGGNCNVNNWGAYDASRVAIWKRYYDTVQTKSPGAYAILEHFADNSEEKELSDYGMLFWGNLNYNFNEATMGFVSTSSFDWALHTSRGWNQPHVMAYMESHDEERLQYKNALYGLAGSGYDIRTLASGLKRLELAASFFLAMPGPKMIWQFGELGYDFSINTCPDGTVNNNCRLDVKPLHWDYLNDDKRKEVFSVYAGMLQLRNHPLFKAGFVTNRVERSLTGAFKWLKLTTDTSNIVVVGNFDVNATTGSLTFPSAGNWYDYFSGTSFTATGAAQSIPLLAGEFHVYVNRNVTYPINFSNIPTPVVDLSYNGKKLSMTVWPNPFRNEGRIEYEIPGSGQTTFKLVNLSGQLISTYKTIYQGKGKYLLPLNKLQIGNNISKGTYFLQMEFEGRKTIQKLVFDIR